MDKNVSKGVISKKDLPPVVFMPPDKENIRLSKAEFVEKMRRIKEEKLEFEKFKKSKMEVKGGVQKVEEGEKEVVPEKPSRGRPKKIEE